LHYYAGRFQNTQFEHWELVSEAWIGIQDYTNPKFASAGIRWAMQKYIRETIGQNHRGCKKSIIQSIDEEIMDNLFCKDTLVAPVDKRTEDNENTNYVNCLLNDHRLSLADKLLLDQRYFQGLTLRQIGEIHEYTFEAIRQRLNRIIIALKKIAKVA